MSRPIWSRLGRSLLGPFLPSQPGRARCLRPRVEGLEERLVPATLNIFAERFIRILTYTGDASVGNNLTVSRAGGLYTFADSSEMITLTGNGTAGWTGSGTNSVSGPLTSFAASINIALGDSTDTLNLGSFDAAIGRLMAAGGNQAGDIVNILGTGAGITAPFVSLTGWDTINVYNQVTVDGTFSLHARSDITLGEDAGDDITAGSVLFQAGATGAGNLTFGTADIQVKADTQSYGAGGVGFSSVADLVANSPNFRNKAGIAGPTAFTFQQDEAIVDVAIPAVAQFPSGLPLNYTIRSDDNSVTIDTASKVAGTNLTVQAATKVDFATDFTNADALAALIATAPDEIYVGNVDTIGAGGQTYNGPVVLNLHGNLTLNAAAAAITFNGTVDSAAAPVALSVNTLGTTTFGNIVGGVNRLLSLTTGAGGTTRLHGAVRSAGTQTYNDAVVLTGDVDFNIDSGPVGLDVMFNGTIDGDGVAPRDLSATLSGTGADVSFNGAVGNVHPLGQMTLANPTKVNGGLVHTVGDQTYARIDAGADIELRSDSGALSLVSLLLQTFNGTLTSDAIDYSTVAGSGMLTLQPASGSASIGLAGAAGTLQLTGAMLAGLADGFAQIIIGRVMGTGTITSDGITFRDPVHFRSPDGEILISGPLTGVGNAAIKLTARTITANAPIHRDHLLTVEAGVTAVFNAVISGNGGLTNGSTGVTTLVADNTYSGLTTQNFGTLLINGNQPLGAFFVTGGELGGVGTVGRIDVIGGRIAPGTSPGILSAIGPVLFIRGDFKVEIRGPMPGTSYDQLLVTGAVDLDRNGPVRLIIAPTSFRPRVGDRIVLIDTLGGVTGQFKGLRQGAIVKVGGVRMRINYHGGADGTDVVLKRVRVHRQSAPGPGW